MGYIAQMAPWLDSGKARFHALACHIDQALTLRRHLAHAEHTRGIRVIAVQNGGAVHVDDIALYQDLVIRRDAVAHHAVDRRADALGKALVIERRGNGAALDRVLVHPAVDVAGGAARGDALGDVIERAHVHRGASANALEIGGGLQQVSGKNLLASLPQLVEALIDRQMAFLILLAAAAPALVVAAEYGTVVIHG